MKMLEVTVTRTVGNNEFNHRVFEMQVKVNGYAALTPAAAKAAEQIAFGNNGNAVVSDGSKAYRITPKTVRKVQIDY